VQQSARKREDEMFEKDGERRPWKIQNEWVDPSQWRRIEPVCNNSHPQGRDKWFDSQHKVGWAKVRDLSPVTAPEGW